MGTSPMTPNNMSSWSHHPYLEPPSPHLQKKMAATITLQDSKIEAQDATIEALASELKQAKERISRLGGTTTSTHQAPLVHGAIDTSGFVLLFSPRDI